MSVDETHADTRLAEVAPMVAAGKSPIEIARRLRLSDGRGSCRHADESEQVRIPGTPSRRAQFAKKGPYEGELCETRSRVQSAYGGNGGAPGANGADGGQIVASVGEGGGGGGGTQLAGGAGGTSVLGIPGTAGVIGIGGLGGIRFGDCSRCPETYDGNGGGGYYGGGGGGGFPGGSNTANGGGGGGSSVVEPTGTNVAGTAGGNPSANGQITITWSAPSPAFRSPSRAASRDSSSPAVVHGATRR